MPGEAPTNQNYLYNLITFFKNSRLPNMPTELMSIKTSIMDRVKEPGGHGQWLLLSLDTSTAQSKLDKIYDCHTFIEHHISIDNNTTNHGAHFHYTLSFSDRDKKRMTVHVYIRISPQGKLDLQKIDIKLEARYVIIRQDDTIKSSLQQMALTYCQPIIESLLKYQAYSVQKLSESIDTYVKTTIAATEMQTVMELCTLRKEFQRIKEQKLSPIIEIIQQITHIAAAHAWTVLKISLKELDRKIESSIINKTNESISLRKDELQVFCVDPGNDSLSILRHWELGLKIKEDIDSRSWETSEYIPCELKVRITKDIGELNRQVQSCFNTLNPLVRKSLERRIESNEAIDAIVRSATTQLVPQLKEGVLKDSIRHNNVENLRFLVDNGFFDKHPLTNSSLGIPEFYPLTFAYERTALACFIQLLKYTKYNLSTIQSKYVDSSQPDHFFPLGHLILRGGSMAFKDAILKFEILNEQPFDENIFDKYFTSLTKVIQRLINGCKDSAQRKPLQEALAQYKDKSTMVRFFSPPTPPIESATSPLTIEDERQVALLCNPPQSLLA